MKLTSKQILIALAAACLLAGAGCAKKEVAVPSGSAMPLETPVIKPPTTPPPGPMIAVPEVPAVSLGLTVTLADDGKTISLKKGGSFLLKLGEGYDWTVTVADQSVVSREKNIAVIRGAQGVYQALKAGKTKLSAVGEPSCRQSVPACAMPTRLFKVSLTVTK